MASGRERRSSRRRTAQELLDGEGIEEETVKRSRGGVLERVRVWWPPTADKSRTGFSGAFWPAVIIGRTKSHFTVRYDNDDEERVSFEHIFPHDVPIEFGREIEELLVGEFVEVSNGSETDPGAWLGCVSEVLHDTYVVKYPFHDAPDETVPAALIRRARIWDGEDWKYIQPGLTWHDGEVASPKELNLVEERAYLKLYLAKAKPRRNAGLPDQHPAKSNKRKGLAHRG